MPSASSARVAAPLVAEELLEAVEDAGLRYVTDLSPGLRRRRTGTSFTYLKPDGTTLRDDKERDRIRRIAIPPAWTDVWICPHPNGHIQATGRDIRGRKQYRYHPKFRTLRDEDKFGRMRQFGESLPKLRRWSRKQLSLRGMPREKVLATVITLLDETLIRVGNQQYAKENRSYGLTTLRTRHAQVTGETVRFAFRGKHGENWRVSLHDRRLARIVKRCQELPGAELFQYEGEDGALRPIESGDVNALLKELTGEDFTAKDFRTWGGTTIAAGALNDAGPASNQRDAARKVNEAVAVAAKALGNKPSMAKKAYVHPALIDAFYDGSLDDVWSAESAKRQSTSPNAHSLEERVVLAVLKRAERRRKRDPLAA